MVSDVGVGLAAGLLGGAVGLIFGSIRLPALIRILRVNARIAQGYGKALTPFKALNGL